MRSSFAENDYIDILHRELQNQSAEFSYCTFNNKGYEVVNASIKRSFSGQDKVLIMLK